MYATILVVSCKNFIFGDSDDTLVDLDWNLSGHSTLDNHLINILHFKLYDYSRTITLLVVLETQPKINFKFSLFVTHVQKSTHRELKYSVCKIV